MNARDLAFEIANCGEVSKAFASSSHPCHEVATWQKTKVPALVALTSPEGSATHRPEPWTGDLEKAPIILLGSNPSWNGDERYPDWTDDWNEDQIKTFGAERFLASPARPYGAVDGPSLEIQDRTYLKSGELSQTVQHWREVRGQMGVLLNKPIEEVSAHSDYVMTEIVHCKSQKEAGVPKALTHCAKLWLDRTFSLSPAEVVIVLGKEPAELLRQLFPDIPKTWGGYKDRGVWPKSANDLAERLSKGLWDLSLQRTHQIELTIGSKTRTVIWLPRPGTSMPRKLDTPGLIDPTLLKEWRSKVGAN